MWVPVGRSRSAALLVAFAFIVAACTSSGGGDSATDITSYRGDSSVTTAPPTTGPLVAVQDPELDWYPCRLEFECATFFAPTDYRTPDRGRVFITIERIPARDPDRRIGVMLVNPGGPGGSGNEFVTFASLAFPQEVLDRFDIIGFDPRGVGESTTIDCISDPSMNELMYTDWTDSDPVARNDAVALLQTVGDACGAKYRMELPFLGTVNAARDMDLIRRALGEEQITFTGLSYGTKLGAVYATLYPDNVRAMVLDGAVILDVDPVDYASVRAVAFEEAYASFAAACNADQSCPIEGDPVVALRELLASTAAEPMETEDDLGRTVSRPIVVAAVARSLYDVGSWPLIAEALAAARVGKGDLILELADQGWGRDRFESFGEGLDAFLGINCADQPERPSLADVAAELGDMVEVAPILGADQMASLLSCTGWPDGASPVPDVDSTRTQTLVVVGTTRDPATPYAWAEALAADLGNAVVVTSDGDGHTAFPWDSCMRDLLVPYLVDLTVPADGARCTSDQAIPPFGYGVDELLQALLLSGVPLEGALCLTEGLSGELDPADLILLLIDDELSRKERDIIEQVANRCVEQLGM